MEQLEEAIEFGELKQFLRLDQPRKAAASDDNDGLADLSAEDAAALVAEIEAVEASKKAA